ncbi:MAG: hypothetical protein GY798_34845 [Hyphomicrobiales bacterium]|nr:hypothetical protein [Hyphomicrobiales bacterium]
MKAHFTDWLIAITIAMWSAVNIAAPSPWLNAPVEETLALWVGGWAIVFVPSMVVAAITSVGAKARVTPLLSPVIAGSLVAGVIVLLVYLTRTALPA